MKLVMERETKKNLRCSFDPFNRSFWDQKVL
jgi:hypothetical protein